MTNKDLEKLWNDNWNNSAIETVKIRYTLREVEESVSTSSDKLKFLILSNLYNFNSKYIDKFENEIISFFRSKEFSKPELYLIYFFQSAFSEAFLITLNASISKKLSIDWNFAGLSTNFSNFSKNHWKSLKTFLNNRDGVKLVLFLRKDRSYKGRLALLNKEGIIEKDWSLQALGKGRVNKPFYVSNGQTPCGIYDIDSVMPKADQQLLFGKYRRLKLEFVNRELIEKEFDEKLLEHYFWKEGIIANELGRSLLRIHGTGLKNRNFLKPYYPFVTTSGCVSLLETKSIHGQRELLDKLMENLELSPVFENEKQIHGTLCVVELDDQKSHVTHEEILNLN
jgi:hypothetical protein